MLKHPTIFLFLVAAPVFDPTISGYSFPIPSLKAHGLQFFPKKKKRPFVFLLIISHQLLSATCVVALEMFYGVFQRMKNKFGRTFSGLAFLF